MKYCSNVLKAMRILRALSGLALMAAFLFNNRCATTALSTRGADKPIKVFELGQRIPRNSRILGISHTSGSKQERFLAGSWSSIGSCGYKPILKIIKKRAKAQDADAIAILYVGKPSTWNRCFTLKAFLLDMIDISSWPRHAQTEEEIRRDLDAGGRSLDDFEGIWTSYGHSEVITDAAAVGWAGDYEGSQNMGDPLGAGVWRVLPSVIQAMEQLSPEQQSSYRLAIVKAGDDADYPYAAYILDPDIPEWKPGFLKARLRKLPDSSGYEAKWYGSTFQADLREFHPDETGALMAKVVIEQGLKYSVEQTLKKVYPPTKITNLPN